MNKDKIYEVVTWLNEQINSLSKGIQEAKDTHNYGREVQYEGMVAAFRKCLDKLSPIQYES